MSNEIQTTSPINRRILIHYAELALKGQNRPEFVKRLRKNVRAKLVSMDMDWNIVTAHDRLFIDLPSITPMDIDLILKGMSEVAGIAWLGEVEWFTASECQLDAIEPNTELIEKRVVELAKRRWRKNASFGVKVKRGLKSFPISSTDFGRQLGACILQQSDWSQVNLTQADETFHVDILAKGVYIYGNKIKGPGGLPVGSSGKGLVLLSGGFDSPVAAYLMARRGCAVDFIHFTASNPQASKVLDYKVTEIARLLTHHTGQSRLFLVPYTYFDMALMAKKVDYDLVLFRRFMVRVAQELSKVVHAKVMITGDNLGQVASQTMDNLVSTSKAVEIPILRPLITYDKQEIIALSRQLGLFDISTQPYKDCCALISKSPKTKSDHHRLVDIETACFTDYSGMIEQTLKDAIQVNFKLGESVELRQLL